MPAKRRPELYPSVNIAVLTDADTGRSVGVSAMWLTTFEETDRGTTIKFTNGEMVTVVESFLTVAHALTRGW